MQLRPEFVKHYAHKFGVPLSSDAFSMFGINGAEVRRIGFVASMRNM